MRKIKIGDVYAIPLPNGLYAYARVFKDLLQDGQWIYVKNIPFRKKR